MIFPTASSTPRPIRLSEEIRDWAWRSLHGQYGDEAIRNDSVSLDDFENFEALSSLQRYDAAIQKIARCAPLRICPEERVCGAATLGLAIQEISGGYGMVFVLWRYSRGLTDWVLRKT